MGLFKHSGWLFLEKIPGDPEREDSKYHVPFACSQGSWGLRLQGLCPLTASPGCCEKQALIPFFFPLSVAKKAGQGTAAGAGMPDGYFPP